jgi:hypothetical protein
MFLTRIIFVLFAFNIYALDDIFSQQYLGAIQRYEKALPDLQNAKNIMNSLAQQHYAPAQLVSGEWLLSENNDLPRANAYLWAAAQQGYAHEIYRFAQNLKDNNESTEKIMLALEAAASADYPPALIELGRYYEAAGNYNYAREKWERAALFGSLEAMNELGTFYYHNGNSYLAFRYFYDAAHNGLSEAIFNTGISAKKIFLENHDKHYFIQAQQWLLSAYSHGHEEALIILDELNSRNEIISTIIENPINNLTKDAYANYKNNKKEAIRKFELLFKFQIKNQKELHIDDVIIYSRLCREYKYFTPSEFGIRDILRKSLHREDALLEYFSLIFPALDNKEILLDNKYINNDINILIAKYYLNNKFIPTTALHYEKIVAGLYAMPPSKNKTELKALIKIYSSGVFGIEKNIKKAIALATRLKPSAQLKMLYSIAQKSNDRSEVEAIYRSITKVNSPNNKEAQCWLAANYFSGNILEYDVNNIYNWIKTCGDNNFNIQKNYLYNMTILVLKKIDNNSLIKDDKSTFLLEFAYKHGVAIDNNIINKIKIIKNSYYLDHMVDHVLPFDKIKSFAQYFLTLKTLPNNYDEFTLNFKVPELSQAVLERLEKATVVDQWAHDKYESYLIYAAASGIADAKKSVAKMLMKNNKSLSLELYKSLVINDSKLHFDIGVAYYYNNEHEPAISHFKEALKRHNVDAVPFIVKIAKTPNLNKITVFNYLKDILEYDLAIKRSAMKYKKPLKKHGLLLLIHVFLGT